MPRFLHIEFNKMTCHSGKVRCSSDRTQNHKRFRFWTHYVCQNDFRLSKAFTVIELVVVMAIVGTLFGISTMHFLNLQNNNYLTTSVSSVISDIKQQQLKAMTSDTQGQTNVSDFGVHFAADRYTLFKGSTYDANDTTNFVINLENNITFTNITLPQSQIVFSKTNGEFASFTNGSNNVTLQNTVTNEQDRITFNKLGIITEVN